MHPATRDSLKSVGGTPAYYTELDNVMSQNVFTAYKYDGTAYDPSADDLNQYQEHRHHVCTFKARIPDVNQSVGYLPHDDNGFGSKDQQLARPAL